MKLAVAFRRGFLCSAMVFLMGAQAPSELGRYQITSGWDTSQGAFFQLDTYTDRLYARNWLDGTVRDLGTVDRPLTFRAAPKR